MKTHGMAVQLNKTETGAGTTGRSFKVATFLRSVVRPIGSVLHLFEPEGRIDCRKDVGRVSARGIGRERQRVAEQSRFVHLG